MAEVSRAYDGPGIGRGGFLLIGLVGLLLISLFFIPEIIEFQRSFLTGTKTPKKQSAVALLKSELGQPEKSSVQLKEISADDTSSSLDSLSSFLDSKESAPEQKEEGKKSAALSIDETRASLSSEAKPKIAKKSKGSSSEITWEKIRSSESKSALVKARKSAIEMSRKVPARFVGTRYALFNFASGVDFLMDHGSEVLSAPEGAAYLNSLDQAVTRAMQREGTDRSLASRWSKVDFGPVVAPMGNKIEVAPFNPTLSLTWVKLAQSHRAGVRDPRALMRVQAGGFIQGDNVSWMELVAANGAVEREIALSRPKKGSNFRHFRFKTAGNHPWTLRVHDKSGKVYQKTYDFYGGSQGAPYSRHSFQFPFIMTYPSKKRFDVEDVDPRIDAHFVSGIWRGTKQQLRSARRGGPAGSWEESTSGVLFSSF